MLFSQHIDSLAAAGVVFAKVWGIRRIIAVDRLGKEFLDYTQNDMSVGILEDGTVKIE